MMQQDRPPIYLYTDGASSGNPGPGGYGIVLKCAGRVKEMSGGFALTTNNRMELLAVIIGLESVRWKNADIRVVSDSAYVVRAVSEGWVFNWEKEESRPVDAFPENIQAAQGEFFMDKGACGTSRKRKMRRSGGSCGCRGNSGGTETARGSRL